MMINTEEAQDQAYIIDGIRTPFGRYGGALAPVRTDDLAAMPIIELIKRHPHIDWSHLDDIYYGCTNQAGEDNRNIARMAALLAGLPKEVPGITVNRLCASSLDAVGLASRALRLNEADLLIAGGVESMSRAPFVIPKSSTPFGRTMSIEDTTIGWRFVNPKMKVVYGIDSMPETAENVAQEHQINRADQDAFALRSQERYAQAQSAGYYKEEILPVEVAISKKQVKVIVEVDEHPRLSPLDVLAKLRPVVRADGTVTAGNASGVNDGAVALLLANTRAIKKYGLKPRVKVLGMASAALAPRVMGMGPVPATQKLLARLGLNLKQMDVIELNEAFAAQGLAVLRQWGLPDDAIQVNPNGGAIALGHPLGATGARLVLTAMRQLEKTNGRYALCTMCVGVGQGVALVLERR
jgi:3-oxoadipyl-CoA thiolase